MFSLRSPQPAPGKTTAIRALTLAWTEDGGQVIALAPSAAATVLAEETGIRADTLAKITWSPDHGELPDWAAAAGPATLVIIDEAGMADTLSLDTVVQFAIGRGASVRLVGDDQQLAAIGARGVLRDIKQTHGVPQLTELHRFTDAAEAQASLTLRDGKPEALNFYLEHGRLHVGDIANTARLNRRARDRRLDHSAAPAEVALADGNRASVGDVILASSAVGLVRLLARCRPVFAHARPVRITPSRGPAIIAIGPPTLTQPGSSK